MINSFLIVLLKRKSHRPEPFRPCSGFAIAAFLLAVEAGPVAAFTQPKPSLDLSPFFAQVDLNHDGCISKAEWFGKGLPESAWNMLKDKQNCVTLKAMTQTPAPEGIDANKDAKLTLDEFLAFDRKGARKLPSS